MISAKVTADRGLIMYQIMSYRTDLHSVGKVEVKNSRKSGRANPMKNGLIKIIYANKTKVRIHLLIIVTKSVGHPSKSQLSARARLTTVRYQILFCAKIV
jgi:hypothetical protein